MAVSDHCINVLKIHKVRVVPRERASKAAILEVQGELYGKVSLLNKDKCQQ